MGKHVLQFLCHGSNDVKNNLREYYREESEFKSTPMSNFIDQVSQYDDVSSFESVQYTGVGEDHKSNFGKFRGYIFGHGADRQSDDICNKVINKLNEISNDDQLDINIYGLSRGGIVGILALNKINNALNHHENGTELRKKLNANISLCDPVPGNWHLTQKIDFINYALVNRSTDLSECDFIKNAKVFITAAGNSIETPSAAHTPILPKFHHSTNSDLFLTDGMHASAERVYLKTNEEENPQDFYLTSTAELIFNETKSMFGFNERNHLNIQNVYCENTFHTQNQRNSNMLENETEQYRTVFTKNGKIDLVPRRDEDNDIDIAFHENGVYKNFSIKNDSLKDEYVHQYNRNGVSADNDLSNQRRIMSFINSRGDDAKNVKSELRKHINDKLDKNEPIEIDKFKKYIKKLSENTGLLTGSSTANKLVDGLNSGSHGQELKKYLGINENIAVTQRSLRKHLSDNNTNNNNFNIYQSLGNAEKSKYFLPFSEADNLSNNIKTNNLEVS